MEGRFDSLQGKNVLITGSSRGIGRAMAVGFAENGANVALHGTKPGTAMEEAKKAISGFGGKTIAVYGDLSDPAAPEKLIKETAEQLGGIDILICNASIQIRNAWEAITDDEMTLQMQVDFFSTVKLIQQAVPYMRKHGWGRIITIGSTQQAKPHPEMLIYSAAKDAAMNVVKSLALQLAREGITVNNIAPGAIHTDRNAEVLKDAAYRKEVENSIPIGRIGQSEDCVGAALLIASDAGSYITGENLFVDGGKFL